MWWNMMLYFTNSMKHTRARVGQIQTPGHTNVKCYINERKFNHKMMTTSILKFRALYLILVCTLSTCIAISKLYLEKLVCLKTQLGTFD